ncbi:TonB-dependent receptor [uncultured Muribaculum sp.]|uniref:SusC/RagA family TonB-linked outer membrane protein n=1 Tax=uncultured Muribaculum sp. TaxID=1918613 RepID=UPI0025913796|nr:TonB-dependent receptor [uncultured Muribaculum sp.]
MGKKLMDYCRESRLLRTALVTLCLLTCVGLANAEPVTVSGTVTSAADGEPLIGVTVQVKGTSVGTTTDFDGNYVIKTEMGATISFSYVGMQTREVTVTSEKLDIALLENSEVLDEVVVVGYGVQKKKLVTGATAQVKGEDIAKLNTTSPLQAMQGQLPGVSIASESGQPGSSMKVTIRGLGTTGNAAPLYLIDGIGGDISTLNPADIESIDVLKDAASAAIYGAQAANGVVLITTKQGREGKTKVTFDGYYGWQSAPRKAKMLNSKQYMAIMDEQAVNSGSAPIDWNSLNSIWRTNEEGERLGVINTNWIDEMFKDNAVTQSYTIGVTGGNATSTFAMSLGYINQEGIVGGKDVSNYSRYNFRINSDHKLFDGLITVGEQASFVYVKSTGIGVGNQYNNTLRGAFGTSPLSPVYNAEGEYNSTVDSDWYKADGNPYGSMMLQTHNRNKNATFSGNVYAQVEPIKNLRVKTVFGAVYGSSEYRSFKPSYKFSIYDYQDYTSVEQNMNHSLGMTWTNTASYDFDIKEHSFSALVGMESYRYSGSMISGKNRNLKEGFDTWPYGWISNGTAASTADGLEAAGKPHDDAHSVSYFARLGWNFKETYMVNFTIRRDGSSKFASGHRFGTFPSVSAGWNISNEKFMESTSAWLDFLKLRLSWGRVGNQNIDNYQYLAPVKSSNVHYFFGQYLGPNGAYGSYADVLAGNWGAYPNRLGNFDLTWETSEQWNVGFDARMLSGRLAANVDLYIKNTKDWLVPAPILATAGCDAPFINGGNVKNKGIELNLTWNDVIGRDFSYSVGVNGSYNHNKVGSIPTEDGMIHGDTNELYDNSLEFYRAANGKPIGYFWGFKTAGIFQNRQEINDWIAAGNGILQADPQPGDVKFVDINNDGIIDDDDKVNLGNGMPKFNFGFNINLYWRNFDLGIVATGSAGFKIVQSYRNQTNKQSNYTTAILDRWTGEGTSNKMPRVTEQNINWQFSDLYIQDGDFLRISNLTVGYNFAPLINQKWCSQCRLYFQAQNLLTFTKYDGMDPEIGYGTKSWVSGVDLGYYPRPRTFLFGVNLAF